MEPTGKTPPSTKVPSGPVKEKKEEKKSEASASSHTDSPLSHRKARVKPSSRTFLTETAVGSMPFAELITTIITNCVKLSDEEYDPDLRKNDPCTPSHIAPDKAKQLADQIIKVIKDKPVWKEVQPENKYNLYISLLMLHNHSGDFNAYKRLLTIVCKGNEEKVLDRLKLLEMQKQFHCQPPTIDDYDRIQEMVDLTIKTKFPPTTQFLIELALSNKVPGLISPIQIPDLLAAPQQSIQNRWCTTACARKDLDFYCANGIIPEEIIFNDQQLALWLYTEVFAFGARNDDIPTTPPDGLSRTSQEHLAELQRALIYRRISGNSDMGVDKLPSFSKYAATFRLMGSIQHLLSALPDMSHYQKALVHFTFGALAKEGFTWQSDPLVAAEHFALAARDGIFPMLLQDAADIFIAYGRYQQAAECLTALLKHPLPEPVKIRLNNQLELCDLHRVQKAIEPPKITDKPARAKSKAAGAKGFDPEWVTEQQVPGSKHKKPTAKPKKGKGSQHAHKAADTGRGKETKPTTTVRTEPAGAMVKPQSVPDTTQPKISDVPGPSVAMAKKSPKKEGATPLSPELSTTPFSDTHFYPEGGWTQDYTHKIQYFLRKVDWCRENCDLKAEQQLINHSLEQFRGKPEYGRICEEACWFYLRQLGIRNEPVALLNDEPRSRNALCPLASQWLCRALACYMNSPIKHNPESADIEQMIENCYAHQPELAGDPEFRKRIRSVCASFGHIHEKLSASGIGKNRSSHDAQSHLFYHLKQLADPDYTPQTYNDYHPKVSLVTRV